MKKSSTVCPDVTVSNGNANGAYNFNVVFVLLGANYNDIPLEQLENLERHTSEIRQTLLSPKSTDAPISGGVLIGTCNRFEVYLDAQNFYGGVDETIRVVSQISGLDVDYVSKVLHVSVGSSVAQHLYSVASGLESMIVGEGEISGQVRRALQESHDAGTATSGLEQLFQTASSVAKRVSTETGLGAAGRSIIATGLELFEARFGALAGKRVLVFGTGAYARVTVAALQRLGVFEILFYSESGRAEEFSSNRETTAVERGGLRNALAEVDAVVTASGSRNYSISLHLAQDVLELQAATGSEPGLKIIDVSLAQSVAPRAYELPGVNILDLEYIHRNAPAEHAEAILAANQIVVEAVAEFEAEQAARSVDPMISALRSHIGTWVTEEVERVRKRAGDQTAQEVARSLNRVTNAMLHTPTVQAKELAKAGNQKDYAKAVKTLFGIDLAALNRKDKND